MGRVFYSRNIRPDELAKYEARGWTEAGRNHYGLDDVGIIVTRRSLLTALLDWLRS